MRPFLRAFAVVSALLAASTVSAKNPLGELWAKQISTSSDALKLGDHARALKVTDKLIKDMVENLGPGDAASQFFGVAVTHKAVALAGLGRKEDALWYWHVAMGLHPPLAKSDLKPFGAAGAFLDANRDVHANADAKPPRVGTTTNITAPRVVKRTEPNYPMGARQFGVSGLMIVELVIATDGTVSRPVVLERLPAPTLTYSALEAVRQWRFEPGRLDGKPVDVLFNLTLNFKLN